MNIDLNHTGIRSDFDVLKPIILGRQVAFDDDGHFECFCGDFNRGQQIQIVFQNLDRRHKHVQTPVTRLNTNGSAHNVFRLGLLIC